MPDDEVPSTTQIEIERAFLYDLVASSYVPGDVKQIIDRGHAACYIITAHGTFRVTANRVDQGVINDAEG